MEQMATERRGSRFEVRMTREEVTTYSFFPRTSNLVSVISVISVVKFSLS